MAVIMDSEDCITTKGIITLEDVVEELIGVCINKYNSLVYLLF